MNIDMIISFAKEGSAKHPKREGHPYIGYGTAGFRTKAILLDHVMYRMGIVAALRAKDKKAAIGIMITASHNPEEDNGIKIVDPAGEMLSEEWEKISTQLANASNEDFPEQLRKILCEPNLQSSEKPLIFIGMDTRRSCVALKAAVVDGIQSVYGDMNSIMDLGVVTTPVVHYAVVQANFGDKCKANLQSYYNQLTSAFRKIVETEMKDRNKNSKYSKHLIVDAANGVGASALAAIKGAIEDLLEIEVVNDGASGKLNHECGADYVKVKQYLPCNLPKVVTRGASLDGDADRIMYYYTDENLIPPYRILDGDKILTLIALHLNKIVSACNLNLTIGIVQTAYANGSSTDFLKSHGLQISCVPTGVKYLHREAHKFDIGVYFEANGHGTVVFSKDARVKIMDTAEKTNGMMAKKLCWYMELINSSVGDGISDMLTVEAMLCSEGINAKEWNELYLDYPNRQLKVPITDRTMIKTTNAERQCTSPIGLQEKIDAVVKEFPKGRSFVRPSGTEDVVRVYAESTTQQFADGLAIKIAQLVYDECQGIGDRPS